MKKALSIILALSMATMVFTSCSGGGSAASANAGNNTAASASKQIDNLNVCVASEPQTIDPALNDAVDGADYIVTMLEGLVTVDSQGNTVGGIAQNWDISPDGITYTFHLRDANWSDGKPVTAGDFVYAWQRVIDPATASPYENYMEYVKNGADIFNQQNNMQPGDLGVKAADDKTLVVTLEAPCGFFLELCGFPTYMPLRQDIVSAHPDDWTQSADTYLSNGPYMLKQWDHNSQIVMARNHKYWNDGSITGPNTITWKLMDDPNSIFTAYKSGQLQFAEGLPNQEYDGLKASGDLVIYNWLGTYYIDMNNTKPPFDNKLVRQAINLVIDRNYIVSTVTKGGEVAANNFVPPGIKDTSGADFNAKATPAVNIDPAQYDANVKQAQDLMAQAGYPNGQGFPTFDYLTNDSGAHVAIATYLQQLFKDKLGISMNVQKMDWNTFLAARQNGDYVVARDGWIADYADPMTFLAMFRTGDGNNNAKYSNTQYDALIDAANKETDPAKRFDDMYQAQNILMNTDYGVCPVYYYTSPVAQNQNLQGIYITPTGFSYFFWTTTK